MKKKLVIYSIVLLSLLPILVMADCSSNNDFICCPDRCPNTNTADLQFILGSIKDDNGDGILEPGEIVRISFSASLPACDDGTDALRVVAQVFDENGKLLKNKTALYSTTGNWGVGSFDYDLNMTMPSGLTYKTKIKLIANGATIHGSKAKKENPSQAFDSCVLEALKNIDSDNFDKLLDPEDMDILKITKDITKLPKTIDTEYLYINKNRFTLHSGKGHQFWDLSVYEMAKCFYFWAECMKRANTECTCCGGQNPSDTRHGISLYGEAESDWIRSRPDIPYIKEFFLSGDENYLNVRWVADYTYGSDIDLSIECELQGNSYHQCLPSPYKQRPGQGSCSVSDPGYDLNGKNYISCEVYNTEHPNFRNINTTQFEPIDFEWNTIDFDAILGVVGVKVSIPVYITNKGFLPDSYKVAFNVINHPENVHFEKTEYTTEIITSGEITSINANIIVTSEEGFTVDICVSSLTNPQKNECKTVKIKGALSNLPDLDNYAILQILILSAFVMLYLRIYKK